MRKIVIVAGLLAGAALFSDSPAEANVGCQCVKFNAPSICTADIPACNQYGGACLAPCDYKPPVKKHKKKKT